MTMIALIIGVYKLIHLWCPSLDFMQQTFFAWVPIILIIGGVYSFFDKVLPTTKSKRQIEEEIRWERERQERELREKERREEELKEKQIYEERQRAEEERRQAYEKRQAEASRREEWFLRYLFSMLAKLAKADGQVDASEVKVAERVFDRFAFAAQRRKFCASVFNGAKKSSRTIYWHAEQFAFQVDDESVRLFVYELLWDIACADGWLHPQEKEILQTICSRLHISEAYYQINYRRRFSTFKEGSRQEKAKETEGSTKARRARTGRRTYVSGRSSILEAYELLECDQTATKDELKTAYRRVAKRYHPDLLRSNGVPEEMIAAATETMAQINAAWEDLRRERGI